MGDGEIWGIEIGTDTTTRQSAVSSQRPIAVQQPMQDCLVLRRMISTISTFSGKFFTDDRQVQSIPAGRRAVFPGLRLRSQLFSADVREFCGEGEGTLPVMGQVFTGVLPQSTRL